MSKRLFITGTGTDVGKTYVSSLIVKKLHQAGHKVAYFKPAMSGNERDEQGELIPGDAMFVKQVAGIHQALDSMCPYVYEKVVSPHLAAKLEGNPVQLHGVLEALDRLNHYEFVVVEGCGGIICPLAYEDSILWQEEVIKKTQAGCLVVADAGLGTINAVGLTISYLKQKNIEVKGIILNNAQPDNILHQDNQKMIEELTGVAVVATVQRNEEALNTSVETLISLFTEVHS